MGERFDFLMRPRRSLLRTAWIALLVGSVPVFAVLYWQATQAHGSLLTVVQVHLVVMLAGLLTYWRQKSVFTGITGGALVGNGIFSPRVRVPLDEIHRVEFVHVESREPDEPSVQFVALDADGRCRFRMRAHYWHMSDLRTLADRLGSAGDRREPLTTEEFFAAYPGSAYWFERHPGLRFTLAAVGVLGAVLGVTALVAAAGMPTFLG
ncbi:hypothetical protein ACFFGH_29230 [Lysobacter korlensis]|uniref:PH domain-containing protein n=1 Tax=Lysobacter korlensis TaxID=553636 RepID=A0ABV6RY81_9GAMM